MGNEREEIHVSNLVGADRGDGTSITLFVREHDGVQTLEKTLHPWLLTSRSTLPTGTPTPLSFTELSGSLPLRFLVTFASWPDLWTCVRSLLDSESSLRGQRLNSYTELQNVFLLPDPIDQLLVRTGTTYFSGMMTGDLSRCILSFDTVDGRPRLSNVEHPDAPITHMSFLDGRGELTSLRIKKKDEKGLLRDAISFLSDQDPDLLGGTDLHQRLLPYLEKRCDLLGIEPTLGRRSSLLRPHPGSVYREGHELPGRSIIDLTDIVLNAELMELYGFFRSRADQAEKILSPIIAMIRSALDLPPPERVKVMDQHILQALDVLLPIMHHTPLNPMHVCRATSLVRTEMAIISRSLQNGSSLPSSGPITHTQSTHEASFRTGVFSKVIELAIAPVDVCTFSLMSESSSRGSSSEPGVSLLPSEGEISRDLSAPFSGLSPERYDHFQGSVHLLRSRHSRFYDEQIADELHRLRRSTLASAEKALTLHNIVILQRTDDTMICQLPDNARTSLDSFWAKIHKDLPHGLRIIALDEFDRCVSLGPRMFTLKSGSRTIHHKKSRIPRFFEPYLKEFFARSLECCLRHDWAAMRQQYVQTLQSIRQGSWHVSDFSRQETLSESFEHYDKLVAAGKRHPAAAYESIRETHPDARAGTVVRYYITGSKKEVTQAEHCKRSDLWDSADPDENTEYYLDRLMQSVERFRILFDGNSFSRIFGGEDLFGFDPTQIQTVEHHSESNSDRESRAPDNDLTISLDLDDQT